MWGGGSGVGSGDGFSDLKTDILVAALSGVWCYKFIGKIGWPGVSIL